VRLVFDDEDFFLTRHVRGINPGVTVCCITFDDAAATRNAQERAGNCNVF
jgi:hypothetical protein